MYSQELNIQQDEMSGKREHHPKTKSQQSKIIFPQLLINKNPFFIWQRMAEFSQANSQRKALGDHIKNNKIIQKYNNQLSSSALSLIIQSGWKRFSVTICFTIFAYLTSF